MFVYICLWFIIFVVAMFVYTWHMLNIIFVQTQRVLTERNFRNFYLLLVIKDLYFHLGRKSLFSLGANIQLTKVGDLIFAVPLPLYFGKVIQNTLINMQCINISSSSCQGMTIGLLSITHLVNANVIAKGRNMAFLQDFSCAAYKIWVFTKYRVGSYLIFCEVKSP